MALLEEGNREGVERSSALQPTALEAVIRTKGGFRGCFYRTLIRSRNWIDIFEERSVMEASTSRDVPWQIWVRLLWLVLRIGLFLRSHPGDEKSSIKSLFCYHTSSRRCSEVVAAVQDKWNRRRSRLRQVQSSAMLSFSDHRPRLRR